MSVLRPSTHSATTSPPRPPSPPFGPPNSMNFSRRNETQPAPPSPERMKTLAWSRNFIESMVKQVGAGFRPYIGPLPARVTPQSREVSKNCLGNKSPSPPVSSPWPFGAGDDHERTRRRSPRRPQPAQSPGMHDLGRHRRPVDGRGRHPDLARHRRRGDGRDHRHDLPADQRQPCRFRQAGQPERARYAGGSDQKGEGAQGAAGLHPPSVPGEHDILGAEPGALFKARYGQNAKGSGYYSFDQNGVHFIGLVNVADLKAGGLGSLCPDPLAWLADDLKAKSASTPIVVFAHIPLWTVYA